MDAGAWWAAVYGVAQSPTWLKQLSSSVYNKLSLVKVLHCYLLLSVSNGPSFWLLPLFLSSVSSLNITTTGSHQPSAVAKYPFLLAKAPYSSFPLSPAPAAAAAQSLQSRPTLCDPIDGSPPGSPIPGILQARTLEWVAISFSNAGKWKVKVKSLSKCPTLCDPMDCSLPGSSVHGIFRARVLEWGAIAFSAPHSY